MASNPFLVTKVNTLREAFPTIPTSVIENTLWQEDGNMDKTCERLLTMTDSSACSTSSGPTCPPTQTNPRITPPSVVRGGSRATNHAKPTLQTVREELAQWRQELQNDREQRRTSRRNLRRPHYNMHTSSSSSGSDVSNIYRDVYSLRDVVNESSAAAVKFATSWYDRFLDANSVYSNSTCSPSSTPRLSNCHRNTNSNLALSQTSLSSVPSIASSISSSSITGNHSTPHLRPTNSLHSRQEPSGGIQPTAPRNPFDNDNADALPPPSYEARENDRLVDPAEADRLLLRASSH